MMASWLTLVELSIVDGRDNRGPRLRAEELLVEARAVVARVVEVRRVAGMVGNVPTSGTASSVEEMFFDNKSEEK
jgi:hypothetical protein